MGAFLGPSLDGRLFRGWYTPRKDVLYSFVELDTNSVQFPLAGTTRCFSNSSPGRDSR